MNEWLVDPALHIFPDTIRHDAMRGGRAGRHGRVTGSHLLSRLAFITSASIGRQLGWDLWDGR